MLLELLDSGAASEYRFCFFVSENDIKDNAGLIRKISAGGHAIGIWLSDGTYAEYQKTSGLLFEAAKIKTILVSADIDAEAALGMAREQGLIFWRTSQSILYDDTLTMDAIIEMLPLVGGERRNLISPCSEFTALMLSGILSYLREYEYNLTSITETVTPR